MCDFRLSYGRVLSRSSKIIIVNRNRKEMLLNSDMFWKPQEAVQGELLGPPPNTYMCFPVFLLTSAVAGLSQVLVSKAQTLPRWAPSQPGTHIWLSDSWVLLDEQMVGRA